MLFFDKVKIPLEAQEKRKRKRETILIPVLGLLFSLLTWLEIRLLSTSDDLPFLHSIFFFGLVNFNIIILLVMLFLIFRNLVKAFLESKGRIFGSSIRGKLVAAFVAFSFVPTLLMFLISVGYINSSFDKWFSIKIASVLKNSLEVTNSYYFKAKKTNYHFANLVAKQIQTDQDPRQIEVFLGKMADQYALDAVEFYPGLLGSRIVHAAENLGAANVPHVSIEMLQKGFQERVESSIIHQFDQGNLVRVIVPILRPPQRDPFGAIVVSSFVPVSLVSRMDDIAAAYSGLREVNPLEYPVKSIYLIILILMTLVILLAATWFGFYLARQLSIPLVMLAKATQEISSGNYSPVEAQSGSDEISQLIDSFNKMIKAIDDSETEVQKTLGQLDERTRYIEVVLANVSTGVISVDKAGKVTTINQHAAELLSVDPDAQVGKSVREIMNRERYKTFRDLLRAMQDQDIQSIRKEVSVVIEGETRPFQMNLSILHDEKGREIGKVLVFDDMSPIINAQRAAAWTEVARRIAHEIKNPLTPIKLSAQRLQRKFGATIDDKAFSESIQMIIQQVDALKNLVNEFSQFARLPEAKMEIGDINLVIEEALLLYRSGHPDVQIDFVPDPRVPEFLFDPEQLKRVTQNLVDNAIAAVRFSHHKNVTVQTAFESEIQLLRMSVIDNGEGIPEGQKDRIFEPYFSTKESGTGLGLPIVKRIVEDHSGYIRAFENRPKGTRMVVEIPVVAGPTGKRKEDFIAVHRER